MLKEIVSISGKPGLFKLISKGKNIFIAESLIDQKRIPVYSRDKVVSLGDITMYSNNEEGDVRLAQIFQAIKQKENGELISVSPSISIEELRAYFSQVFPDFDRDRVYPSDIKKVMNWYNLMVKCGLTEFEEGEENREPRTESRDEEKQEPRTEMERIKSRDEENQEPRTEMEKTESRDEENREEETEKEEENNNNED